LFPAYEDAFYYSWKERRFPTNVTPEKTNLKDKLERERIARIFQQGLGSVVGYTLPIKRGGGGWVSGSWFLRDDDTLWLIPGDSPMGLRLPLDSIPWVAEKDFPWLRQQDPSQPELPELPGEFPYRQRFLVGQASSLSHMKARRGSSAPRCASSRATDDCMSSCRRRRRPRIISNSSPVSKPPSLKWERRSSLKAKHRPKIRA
jgi:uncharacterized protein (DUF2126 family)